MGTYLGIDAGGSHTRAVLVSAAGDVLGHGRAGPANFRTGSFSDARASITAATRMALEQHAGAAGTDADAAPRSQIVSAFIGSAGLEGPGEERQGRELLGGVASPRHVRLDSDVIAAWGGAFGGQAGIVLCAGTGSICVGVTAAGERVRAGGWGPVFGDEGSAYAIARHGIKAALASVDGRGKATSLLPEFLRFLGVEAEMGCDVLELHGATLTGWLYAAGRSQADIARFAPVVEDAALRDDHAAVNIIGRAGKELAALVATVVGRWEGGGGLVPVATNGAVLRRNGLVREHFLRSLAAERLPVEVQDPLYPPELGAALLAMEVGGLKRSEEVMMRIAGTMEAVLGRSAQVAVR